MSGLSSAKACKRPPPTPLFAGITGSPPRSFLQDSREGGIFTPLAARRRAGVSPPLSGDLSPLRSGCLQPPVCFQPLLHVCNRFDL